MAGLFGDAIAVPCLDDANFAENRKNSARKAQESKFLEVFLSDLVLALGDGIHTRYLTTRLLSLKYASKASYLRNQKTKLTRSQIFHQIG